MHLAQPPITHLQKKSFMLSISNLEYIDDFHLENWPIKCPNTPFFP
jgi:hypothetical protein